jgi:hypothetical protein
MRGNPLTLEISRQARRLLLKVPFTHYNLSESMQE